MQFPDPKLAFYSCLPPLGLISNTQFDYQPFLTFIDELTMVLQLDYCCGISSIVFINLGCFDSKVLAAIQCKLAIELPELLLSVDTVYEKFWEFSCNWMLPCFIMYSGRFLGVVRFCQAGRYWNLLRDLPYLDDCTTDYPLFQSAVYGIDLPPLPSLLNQKFC